MTSKKHIMLYDPIPFHGGSKIATSWAMKITDDHVHFHVLTADPQTWHDLMPDGEQASITPIVCPAFLLKQAYGTGYWAKQAIMSLYLFLFYFIVIVQTRSLPHRLILASGPSVDLAGYLVSHLTHLPILQLIHGNVSASRAAHWGLNQGHETYYLDSTKMSIIRLFNQPLCHDRFHAFVNGIPSSLWPTERRHSAMNQTKPKIFWSASLLKWKGLDLLVDTLKQGQLGQKVTCNICYIKPQQTLVETSELPAPSQRFQLYHQPDNLDEIRASSDIFVSTSHKEPFGLAILEALATGLIVVIPNDGAYWDKQLTCGVNCVKYPPNDVLALAKKLETIANDLDQFQTIADAGKQLAQQYRAEKAYKAIAKSIEGARNEVIQNA